MKQTHLTCKAKNDHQAKDDYVYEITKADAVGS